MYLEYDGVGDDWINEYI